MENRIAILISTRDRVTELSLLLQSLRTQTIQNFDIYILDDFSGTPFNNYHFFNCMVNRLKEENHKVFYKKTQFQIGASKARQECVDWCKSMPFKYEYFCRLDDDVVLESDYLERLLNVIESGYDMASGVTVPMAQPTIKRDPKFLGNVINQVILDKDGNYIKNGDDCGMRYTKSVILPAHHFRSCALYKSKIHEVANYVTERLSPTSFREEQFFSYNLQLAGYKIGVDTGAITYHQMTPSGGCRDQTYNQRVQSDQRIFEEFTKEHKNKLRSMFEC